MCLERFFYLLLALILSPLRSPVGLHFYQNMLPVSTCVPLAFLASLVSTDPSMVSFFQSALNSTEKN